MKWNSRSPVVLLATLLSFHSYGQLPTVEPPRTWKTAQGAAFQATLLSFDGKTAVLKMPNGQRAQAPLDRLSSDDAAYLADWTKKQPIAVILPDIVGVETSTLQVEVVKEDAAAAVYIYRTPHFEFESAGKFAPSLLREVARNFEATYELVKALPWGITPHPIEGTHFKARLLADRAAYTAAGGPPNSGGVYMGGQDLFLVPFESIGIKPVGKSFAKDDDFDSSTLVHELTHQMMSHWIRALPQWVVEGTAEYTSNIPLKTGKFRVSSAKRGLKEYTEFLQRRVVGGVPTPYPLEDLLKISSEQWGYQLATDPTKAHRAYFTSYLLVYYFMHMDGKGDGQRFVKYFREVGAMLKSGRIREIAANSTGKALELLLDGRSEADLMKEIRSAYKKLGITL
jgi:hypothetical protein